MQKAKWLSGEALLIAVKRREKKSKGEKEGYKHLNAECQRIARRYKKTAMQSLKQAGRAPCDGKGRDWNCRVASQGTPKISRKPSEARRRQGRSPCKFTQKIWLCQHLDFRLLGLQKC